MINAALPEHLYGFNGFANVNYQKGNFRSGIRYESYLNTLEGYPTTFNGTGLGYRYMSWSGDGVGVTIGNFYDQFGSGMIFRAYEERQLGIDNALDGINDSRNVCIFAEGEVDRSPTGSGVSGRMAIHKLRKEIDFGEKMRIESITDSVFVGSIISEENYGPFTAVIPQVEGTAHITGMHTFVIDPKDPMKNGFILH